MDLVRGSLSLFFFEKAGGVGDGEAGVVANAALDLPIRCLIRRPRIGAVL